MISTPPLTQLIGGRECKTLNARPIATDKVKQMQYHFPVKNDRTECNRFKQFCFAQLKRLFHDFWSHESKLTVLSELLLQQNLIVLAILREHIKHVMDRIERAPSAQVLVPLFKSAAAGDIALSKAHLTHVKLLFYYVCLAHRKCVHVCNITAHRRKQSGPPVPVRANQSTRVAYPCY